MPDHLLAPSKVSISLSTPICCSIILYVVWQATAGMLLSVEPFLLNNKPQLWVVTTEPDQFFTTKVSTTTRIRTEWNGLFAPRPSLSMNRFGTTITGLDSPPKFSSISIPVAEYQSTFIIQQTCTASKESALLIDGAREKFPQPYLQCGYVWGRESLQIIRLSVMPMRPCGCRKARNGTT